MRAEAQSSQALTHGASYHDQSPWVNQGPPIAIYSCLSSHLSRAFKKKLGGSLGARVALSCTCGTWFLAQEWCKAQIVSLPRLDQALAVKEATNSLGEAVKQIVLLYLI